MPKSNGAAKTKTKTREVENRELPVKLTEAELLQRADEMAKAELEIELLQLERTSVTRKINDVKKTRATLAHTIDSGSEERTVRCVWHEDFPKNVFRLKREDTGAEVDTRPMTALDRTSELPFDDDFPNEDPPPRTPTKKPRGKKSAAAAAA